jgi:hypothetical protein
MSPAPALPFNIQVRANDRTDLDLRRGEFLILSASILNVSVVQDGSHNTGLSLELDDLKRRYEAGEMPEEVYQRKAKEIQRGMIPITTYRIGGPDRWPRFIRFQVASGGPWKDAEWPLHLLLYQPEEETVEFPPNQTCYVEYGLDAEEVASLQRGEYQVRAVLELMGGWTVISPPVTVKILRESVSADEMATRDSYEQQATYLLKRGKYPEASGLLEEGFRRFPGDLGLLQLQGLIEARRGNYTAALSLLERYLEESFHAIPPPKEPPQMVIQMIVWLKEQMKKKRGV